jgi:hypothetical protein
MLQTNSQSKDELLRVPSTSAAAAFIYSSAAACIFG